MCMEFKCTSFRFWSCILLYFCWSLYKLCAFRVGALHFVHICYNLHTCCHLMCTSALLLLTLQASRNLCTSFVCHTYLLRATSSYIPSTILFGVCKPYKAITGHTRQMLFCWCSYIYGCQKAPQRLVSGFWIFRCWLVAINFPRTLQQLVGFARLPCCISWRYCLRSLGYSSTRKSSKFEVFLLVNKLEDL